MKRIKYKKIRIPIHILFWIGVLIFYTFLFGSESGDYSNVFYFVIWLLPITIATTYFLNYFLIPQYLFTKKYFRFGLYLFYTTVISITLELNVVIFNLVFAAEFNNFNMMIPASFNIFYLIAGNYLVVFFGVAIKLINQWFGMERKTLALEKESMEIELKLKEAQLKLLKAQIHPHFLFNTLNNLYGLTLTGSEKSPEVVLKISSLLDFMIYRSSQSSVKLEEEIGYIKDYISLEELRYSKLKINFVCMEDMANHRIAPMILQPFVENAFKHGTSKDIASPRIDIQMNFIGENQFSFTIKNSKSKYPQDDKSGYTEGIGLVNVKERLKILYPEKHSLLIEDKEDEYKVELNITLDS